MRPIYYFMTVIMLILSLAQSSFAHHTMSKYDLEKTAEVVGTVTRVHWVNPHVYIYIDQLTDSGELVNWEVEGLNPASMRRMGWTKNTLRLGDELKVSGNPGKEVANRSLYPYSIFRDGDKLFDEKAFYTSEITENKPLLSGAASIAGIWKGDFTPEVVEYISVPSAYSLTSEGEARLAQYDEKTMSPAISCTKVPAPLVMLFDDAKEILVTDKMVSITGDYDGGKRIIHLDSSTHAGAVPSSQGHSIGQWEGNDLVIDTTHFENHLFGNGVGLPSSSQKHLVESLSLSDDGKSIRYEFELFDPEYLASSLTMESEWAFRPDLEFFIDECDLESARRFLED